jgi:hypothetical protein
VGVVTAVLAAVWHPAAVGVSPGSGTRGRSTPHLRTAGLYAVGSLMLAVGSAGGTALAASVGAWVRTARDAVHRRHTPRKGFEEPGIIAG